MLRIPWTAKKDKHKSNGKGGTNKVVGEKIEKTTGYLYWS